MTTRNNSRIQCDICTRMFDCRGLANHRRACDAKRMQMVQHQDRIDKAEQARTTQTANSRRKGGKSAGPTVIKPWENIGQLPPETKEKPATLRVHNIAGPARCRDPSLQPIPDTVMVEDVPLDAIRIEYHPHMNLPPKIVKFEEYREYHPQHRRPTPRNPTKPWTPFRTRAEFEFAEVALDAALNKRQVEALLKVFHRCLNGEDKFGLKEHADLTEMWEHASVLHARVETTVLSVPYAKNDVREFKLRSRSLWEWALSLVKDPILAPHFQWDAQRLSKFDGKEFIRFIHEPYTANRFWDIQSSLPPNGKLLALIVYADKTKLSSFGTATGYPVVVRMGNLPVDIRNGKGIGGGELVGWLPIVPEDEAEKGKKGYVDFKRVVWHEAFKKLLETLPEHSKVGCWTECGDKIDRQLFPGVIILSSDYEEQSVMAGIRGFGGLEPCPTCHAPHDQLHDCSQAQWPLRTGIETQKIIHCARKLKAGQAEKLLKKNGLRPVDNAFMTVCFSDPHQAISWDGMHAHDHGLGGKHLWPALQKYIKEDGRDGPSKVDIQARSLPTWRKLYHFDKIMDVSYTDANKLKDLVKISIFVSHNVIDSQNGSILLQCMRAYLNLNMIIGFNVHTTETIAMGEEALGAFSNLMKVYATACKKDGRFIKDWNFPKMHSHVHVFADIMAKGATINYDTKPNEGTHSGPKATYKYMSNGKEFEDLIMKIDHWQHVSLLIRGQIDILEGKFDEEDEADGLEESAIGSSPRQYRNVVLGAKQKPLSFSDIEAAHPDDAAFQKLQERFCKFLSITLPEKTLATYKLMFTNLTISEYRYIKVTYESRITWQTNTDHLRCNPTFQRKPRYDCVIINTTEGNLFARLIFIFVSEIDEEERPWALIQPYDMPIGRLTAKEKKLELFRVRGKPRRSAEFVDARSIIRGVLLVPTFGQDTDYYVFDVLDADIFMRVRELWKDRELQG